MYVCLCQGVTDRDIHQAIDEGASSVEEIMYLTRAGTRCGSCIPTIRAILEQVTADSGVDSTKRRLNVVYDDVVTTAA
ncbi:MAG: (2Fe-2S)-binding protein [Byssovorax sp.]